LLGFVLNSGTVEIKLTGGMQKCTDGQTPPVAFDISASLSSPSPLKGYSTIERCFSTKLVLLSRKIDILSYRPQAICEPSTCCEEGLQAEGSAEE
jgi:hypothetical protein